LVRLTLKEKGGREMVYLGDSVYAENDGYHIILTTRNDNGPPSNIIYLEPQVCAELRKYIQEFEND
jgi:hypothetical protein